MFFDQVVFLKVLLCLCGEDMLVFKGVLEIFLGICKCCGFSLCEVKFGSMMELFKCTGVIWFWA